MGIKFLNQFLRDKCNNSIAKINISDLTNKKIAVDISIYLYKYEATDSLLENIYLMLSIFRLHNIIPVFIFDGKPPPEKRELLKKRQQDKTAAKNEYNKLKEQIELNGISDEEKQEIIVSMDQLKKQFVYMNHEKIEKVKELMRAFGATYYDAPGEADELCALLVNTNKVWACLSEDMDLFVYGCKRVLRYISLNNQSVILYYTKGILNELNMNLKEFREICVLSGTDYNINFNVNINVNVSALNLFDIINLFRKFQEEKEKEKELSNQPFYHWLNLKLDLKCNLDLELLNKINSMFNISDELTKSFKNIQILNCHIQKNLIKEIMKGDGFIFLN
jgi:5'-3' exonuclease